jgi:hypothetical protein
VIASFYKPQRYCATALVDFSAVSADNLSYGQHLNEGEEKERALNAAATHGKSGPAVG